MIVSFTGSRNGMTDVQKCIFEGLISNLKEFHHGSCQGADVEAARIVRRSFTEHILIVSHPGPDGDPCRAESEVDDVVEEPRGHLARNRLLTDLCDVLYACPAMKEPGGRAKGGTWYTINYARKRGKKRYIIYPDGSIEE